MPRHFDRLPPRSPNGFALQPPSYSYPIDYRGSWSGELTVSMLDTDKRHFAFAPGETQQTLLKPGIKGTCSLTFYERSTNKIELRPAEVVSSDMNSVPNQVKSLANAAFLGLFCLREPIGADISPVWQSGQISGKNNTGRRAR